VHYREIVFKSTICEVEHPVVQVHPLTGERAIILGHFARKLLGVSAADSGHLFAMLQDHVTQLENTVRWRWSVGDVVIWTIVRRSIRQSMITATSAASCAA
jgi:alpha-ketoglutarate-dependent sulfate ester dioxygenase